MQTAARVAERLPAANTADPAHLQVAAHVILDNGKCGIAQQVKELDDALGCIDELGGVDAIFIDDDIGV